MTDHVIINAPEGSNPNGWTDGEPLMEAIATAVYEQCTTEPTVGLVVDDPRNIAAVAAAVARRLLATDPDPWPTPEQAYATAPDAPSELNWLCDREPYERDREWWLRRAAVVDRMAYGLAPGTVTEEQATDVARRLMDLDDTAVICDPRHYVRQQYARWTTDHH